MAAANTDLLRKKKSLFSTTLSSGISAVDTSMTLASTSGLPTDTAITLTLDRVDANGVSTPSLRERVTGVVSGSTVTNLVRGEDGDGGTGKVHSSGAVVEDIWEAETWNDTMTLLMATHEQVSGRIKNETFYAADAGANDTYAITMTPAPAAYVTGMIVFFKANTANTGACTLNVNTLGAKTIKKNYNSDLADNDILANQLVAVIYDGTNFQLLSPVNASLVTLTGTQTLTNKTLTSPVINTGLSGTAKATGAEVTTGTEDAKFVTPKAIGDSNYAFLKSYAESVQTASVANPAGTSYAASAGTDPSVTVTTGTKALVIVSARINSAGNFNFVGFEISGATTLAASDANAGTSNIVGYHTVTKQVLVTLNAGSNVFTMKYKCNVSASGAYDLRSLTVIPLP